MTNFTDTKAGKSGKRGRRCYMAYTLNNTQPVVCTLVADQPYFYMEDQEFQEDDDFLGLESYADFEKDLADLKKKMEIADRISKSYECEPERRLEMFSAEAINVCDQTEKRNAAKNTIEKITGVLNESRMARALLDFAKAHGAVLAESDQASGVHYDRESGKILIHPALAETEQCLLTVRELRRHWQHRKGVLIHPLTFFPDQAVLINRAQIADLSVAMIRVAWELQLAGKRTVWEYIENSPMADLGRSFAREAFVDFRSLANGKASSAVFESWFLSERCRYQDKKLIQAMLADHQGYVFANEEASRNISIELITTLGDQPFGKNYLSPYAQMIISDPIFTEVRDRSNANFLWFIKFERSFRETEQALQGDEGPGADGLSAHHQHRPNFSAEHSRNGSESIIIPINRDAGFIHRRGGYIHGSDLEGQAERTNVIHVRFGRAERP